MAAGRFKVLCMGFSNHQIFRGLGFRDPTRVVKGSKRFRGLGGSCLLNLGMFWL